MAGDVYQPQRRRRRAATAAALAAAVALGGCGVGADLVGVPDLPESPDVETAPWPRLADGPSPAPTDPDAPDSVARRAARGAEIDRDLAAETEGLEAERRRLSEGPSPAADEDLEREAARLREEARRLLETPVE